MSMLIGHAKATMIIGECLAYEAEKSTDEGHKLLLSRMAQAHIDAAQAMEILMAREAKAMNAPCSIDHKAIEAARCPACGGPRER